MKHNMSTLSVLHYVYGAFLCVLGLMLLLIVALGHFLNSDWLAAQNGDQVPPIIGHVFVVLGWVLFGFVEVKGIMNILSGTMIARRRNKLFSQITAGLDMLNIPFGMALGIFTFITLNNEEVRREYALGLERSN